MNFRIIIRSVAFTLLLISPLSYADFLELTIASFSGEEKGVVVIKLNKKDAPNHAKRIKTLTNEGAYTGIVFHRVIDKFMAQTGDVQFGNINSYNPVNVGKGSSQYEDLKAELSNISYEPGVVGMARSPYINSANSQFFIMTAPNSGLNGSYTVIGKVINGLDVVRSIKLGDGTRGGMVSRPDYIKKAVIVSVN